MKKLIVLMMAMALCLGFGANSWASFNATTSVDIADGGIGDVLLGPLYDLRVDENRKAGEVFGPRAAATWQNLFVIENTSPLWTAVHLRFRESKCSVEVWDHVILLSPYDMFWFGLDWWPGGETPDGYVGPSVKIFSRDYETLFNSGMIFEPDTLYYDFFKYDLLEETCNEGDIRFGHVEAIGLWQLDLPEEYKNANKKEDTHSLIKVVRNLVDFPGDPGEVEDVGNVNVYDLMDAAYYQFGDGGVVKPGEGWLEGKIEKLKISATYESGSEGLRRYFLDCGNALAGNYLFGDLGTAEMGLENLIALRNFRTYDYGVEGQSDLHRDRHPSGAIVFPTENLPPFLAPDAFGSSPAYYLNPDWATTNGATLRCGDNLIGAGGDFNGVWSLDDVEFILAKTAIWYNYFQGAAFGGIEDYSTEVVVTFPTKYLHSGFAMPYWNSGGYLLLVDYWAAVASYRCGICNTDEIKLTSTLWDSDERIPLPGAPEPSPGVITYDPTLPDETNIFWVTTDEGLRENPNVLYTLYNIGHFRLTNFREFALRYGSVSGHTFASVPPIGLVYFRHTFTPAGAPEDTTRSAMAEWHYVSAHELPYAIDANAVHMLLND